MTNYEKYVAKLLLNIITKAFDEIVSNVKLFSLVLNLTNTVEVM